MEAERVMLITRTPLRISLLGGGTDQKSFYEKSPGAVVSLAINKYIYLSVNNKFDGKFRVSYSKTENVERVDQIEHNIVRECLRNFEIRSGLEIISVSDIPGNGTGLGSSSAFTVGLVKALGREIATASLAERAYRVERGCGNNPGKQDAYASAFGGFNRFIFHPKGVERNSITPHSQWMDEFESRSLLLWTGMARDSSEILKAQEGAFEDGRNIELGIQLARLANDFYIELLGGADMKRIGEFLSEGWQIKKMLARGISNPSIDNLYELAEIHGAYGAKVCGAGGGGFLFCIAPPEYHAEIVEATGLRQVKFKIENEGSKVIYNG